MGWQKYIPKELQALYQFEDYRHAAAILANEFPEQFQQLCAALSIFRFSAEDVKKPGGNRGPIVKRFARILGGDWKEMKRTAKWVFEGRTREEDETKIVDTHKIDFTSGKVAVETEWNSKDQTFDRDLFAFQTFHQWENISVGVLITRGKDLDPWINREMPKYKSKFGATTTHWAKLEPRMQSGRHGSCPVLVIGIQPTLLISEADLYARLVQFLKPPAEVLAKAKNSIDLIDALNEYEQVARKQALKLERAAVVAARRAAARNAKEEAEAAARAAKLEAKIAAKQAKRDAGAGGNRTNKA